MTCRSVRYVHHQDNLSFVTLISTYLLPMLPTQLMTFFLHNSTRILQSWTITGVGLRRALEVGAHRKHLGAAPLTIESELWRRAFWYVHIWSRPVTRRF